MKKLLAIIVTLLLIAPAYGQLIRPSEIRGGTAGGLVYSNAVSLAISSACSSGQVYLSGGTGAPTCSTPTFPSTSGAAGTILRSDGTNWLASTPTYANSYTQGSILYNATASVVTGLAVTSTEGKFIRAGAAATYLPEWSALVLPNAATQYNLLYASATDTISGLATGNSGVLVTSSGGVPSIATDIPTAVTIGSAYIYRVGGTDVSVADGGTGLSAWTTANGIVYAINTTTLTNGSGLTWNGTVMTLTSAGATSANITSSDNAQWRGYYMGSVTTSGMDMNPNSGEVRIGGFSTGDYYLVIYSDGVAAMTFGLGAAPAVTIPGNVGIGTTAPTASLNIMRTSGDSGDFIRLSHEDISHGVTTILPTDTFGAIRHSTFPYGGVDITGITDADVQPIKIVGISGSASPIAPMIHFQAEKKNGTGVQDLAAGEIALGLTNRDTYLMTVLGNGNVGIGTVVPDRLIHGEASSGLTATIQQVLRLSHITSGTPANSIGLGLEFEQETSASNNEVIATIESVVTDVTATEEDAVLVFRTMVAGAAAAEVFRTGSGGTTIASSSLSIGGIAYTYPGDNGDAGEQLQTDGSGALTWEAAASRREYKDVLRQRTTPVVALQTILATPIYDFKYRRDLAKGTGDYETIYTGPMAEEAPWAMHHGGSILNLTNIAGYSILAIQAMHAEIEQLKAEIAELKKSGDGMYIQIDGFVEGVDVTQPNQILRVN